MTDYETVRPNPAELRRRADVLLAQAAEVEEAQRAEAERAQAEAEEQAKLHRYLAAVEQARSDLAAAMSSFGRAEAELDAARNEKGRVKSLVGQAERDAQAARAELISLADGDDLAALRDARIAVAAAEDAPRLLAPRAEKATSHAQACAAAVETARQAVIAAWDQLGRLGARDGLVRPACLPELVPESEMMGVARAITATMSEEYGRELSPAEVAAILVARSGSQFEPESVKAERFRRAEREMAAMRAFVDDPSLAPLRRAAGGGFLG